MWRHHRPATVFALEALGTALATFAFLRFPPVERSIVQALIDLQTSIANWYGAPDTSRVVVDPSCSGADIIALCVGVTVAYPAGWRARLAGAGGALLTILTLNTIRIGTLLAVADAAPARVALLHEYVWPALLVAGVVAYVWLWTMAVERRSNPTQTDPADDVVRRSMPGFMVRAIALLVLNALAAPWTMTSVTLQAAGAWTVSAAHSTAGTLGVETAAAGTILTTARGAFQVTPECLFTPLLPLYLAAALTFPGTARRRWLWLAAAGPIFLALGVLRLLVLALPAAVVASPVMLAHGFFQLVCAAGLLAAASVAGRTAGEVSAAPARLALRWGLAALGGVLSGVLCGGALASAVGTASALMRGIAPHALTTLTVPADVQGALLFMPAYQLGLLVGAWIALTNGRRWKAGVAALLALTIFEVLWLVGLGEWSTHVGAMPHTLVLRAWNVGLPAVLAWYLLWPADGHTSVGRNLR